IAVIKRLKGKTNVCCRGLDKNARRKFTALMLVNCYLPVGK
ncbi:MAG: IS5/IS1182 family transposase, partial [Proteobacteria bacterium]|nr:IS5/IS1182 family transposase [Pseudomonadota bacterium]